MAIYILIGIAFALLPLSLLGYFVVAEGSELEASKTGSRDMHKGEG